MSADDRYRVVNSRAVADEYRLLVQVARDQGRLRKFLDATKWVMEELARTPFEFGESWDPFPGDGLIYRRGFARPLHVQYAVHVPGRTVFICRITLTN